MNQELSALEERIEQFTVFSRSLRAENQELRLRVAELEGERDRLKEKIDTACGRLEALMEKFPRK